MQNQDDPLARRDFELHRLVDPRTGGLPDDIHAREQAHAARLPRRSEDPRKAIVSPWLARGPYDVGGRTRALALDRSDPHHRTLLAGGASGGMWRSTDRGQSWSLTTGSSQLHSVSCILQDPRPGHEQEWYYGTGEYRGADVVGRFVAPYLGDGVFRSVDGGRTWHVLPSTSTATPHQFDQNFDYVWRLQIDPTNLAQTELYAATYAGVQRSTDGGDSWTLVWGDARQRSRWSEVLVNSQGTVYGTLSSDGWIHGIFRSFDGLTWEDISPPVLRFSHRIVLACAPTDEQVMYALVANMNAFGKNGLFRSDDGGDTWIDRSSVLTQLPFQLEPDDELWTYESYAGYCQALTVSPTDPDVAYIGGVHLFRSTDGFATVENITRVGGWEYENHHADQHWMMFEPGSDRIAYTGSDGGVHRTDDVLAPQVSWTSLNNGYNTSQFYTVAFDPDTPNDILVGGLQDNGTRWTNTADHWQPWRHPLGADGAHCAVLDHSGDVGTYYFSTQFGQVYRYRLDANGEEVSWARVDPADAGHYMFINPLLADPVDPRILYVGTSEGVWRNSNTAQVPALIDAPTAINWTHITLEPSSENVSALAMSPAGDRILYYGTSLGRLYKVRFAHQAPAEGAPKEMNRVGLPASAFVSDIVVDRSDQNRMLVSFANYSVPSVFYTETGGLAWIDVEGNLGGEDGPSVRSVAMLLTSEGWRYFAGTSTGLYSTDALQGNATVWMLEAGDLIGNAVVDMVRTREADGLVVAATHGKGVYSRRLDPTGAAAPRRAFLAQPFPNPFNAGTSIRFQLDREGAVQLVVFDVAGRRVRTLVNENRAAGTYVETFDGHDDAGQAVASGVYTVQIRAPGLLDTRKMTLLR